MVPQCSYATLLRGTAIERSVVQAIRDANDAALLLPPMLRRYSDAVRITAVAIIQYFNIVIVAAITPAGPAARVHEYNILKLWL